MSTFNQQGTFGPKPIDRNEDVSRDTDEAKTRPSPEKVSPTQQGKFLSELEKKEKKKELKPVSPEGQDEGDSVEETDAGIFGLAGMARVKAKKSLSEKKSSEEEGDEFAGEEHKPSQAEGLEQAQIAAAAQSATHLQKPIEVGSKETAQRVGPKTVIAQEQVTFRSDSDKPGTAKKDIHPPLTQAIISQQQTIQIEAKDSALAEAKAAREALFEVFRQAVDAIAMLSTKNTTTTIVTIKNPPIFEGASLLLTEYSSAKKEYNITFSNLSPDARRLLESTNSETQLRQTLIDKGYTLHMMTIDTRPPKITPSGIETTMREGQYREPQSRQEKKEEKEQQG